MAQSPKLSRGSYRTPDRKAQIDWELKDAERGPEFSATGEYDGSSGQCIDSIAQAYPKDETVQALARISERYHLNGMNAGTPEQSKAIREWESKGNTFEYAAVCAMLKARGLYEVPVTPELRASALGGLPDGATVYKYGERWLYRAIPAEVIAELDRIAGNTPTQKPLHEHKATQFLKANGLKLRITKADSKPAPWGPSGHHYRVTLSRSNSKAAHAASSANRLAFDFWGSAADLEAGKNPTPYDVLACISSDIFTPETFEDFCADYGESEDSIKAKQTFARADRFAKRLRAFLTTAEQTEMAEICRASPY